MLPPLLLKLLLLVAIVCLIAATVARSVIARCSVLIPGPLLYLSLLICLPLPVAKIVYAPSLDVLLNLLLLQIAALLSSAFGVIVYLLLSLHLLSTRRRRCILLLLRSRRGLLLLTLLSLDRAGIVILPLLNLTLRFRSCLSLSAVAPIIAPSAVFILLLFYLFIVAVILLSLAGLRTGTDPDAENKCGCDR